VDLRGDFVGLRGIFVDMRSTSCPACAPVWTVTVKQLSALALDIPFDFVDFDFLCGSLWRWWFRGVFWWMGTGIRGEERTRGAVCRSAIRRVSSGMGVGVSSSLSSSNECSRVTLRVDFGGFGSEGNPRLRGSVVLSVISDLFQGTRRTEAA
jgi:hypothetical protein